MKEAKSRYVQKPSDRTIALSDKFHGVGPHIRAIQKQLILIRERHWPIPSQRACLGTPGLARRLAREKERHPDIGQDRVQAIIALACTDIGDMMEPCPHGEGDTLRGEVLEAGTRL